MAPLATSWAPLLRASALGLAFGLPMCSLKFLSTYTPSWSPSSATAFDSARIYCGIPSCEPGPDMPKFAIARLEAPTVNPITAAPAIVRDERPSDITVLRVRSLPGHMAPDFWAAEYALARRCRWAKSLALLDTFPQKSRQIGAFPQARAARLT